MPEREEKKEKVKVSFPFVSIGIRILIFAALVAATALALRPLQLGLLERMEQGRDEFFTRVEKYWGRRIQYGSMGPSIFGVLDIRDVRILRDDDSVLLSISRLRLSYSLLGLLQGNVLDSFNSVRLDRPVLSLDFEKEADLVERFVSFREQNGGQYAYILPQAERQSLQEMLPEDFSLRIWNGEWHISAPFGRVMLYGVELEAAVQQSRVSFQGSWNASGALNGAVNGQTELAASMTTRFSGEYLYDRGEGSATVVIPSLYGERVRLNPLTISFFLSNGQLEARKTHDRSPIAVSVVYDLAEGRLTGNFEGENFPLSDILVFSGLWEEYNSSLDLRISGSASIEREHPGGFSYTMDFSGFLPGNSPAGNGSLAVKAWGDGEHITIDNLVIHSASGDLSFRGGMYLETIVPHGFLSLSNFSLRDGAQGISGDFSLNTQGREISLFGENISAGDAGLSILDASFYREEEGFTFVISTENARLGSFFLEGSVDNSPRQLRATLMMNSFPIGDILSFVEPLAPVPEIPSMLRSAADEIYVTTEVFFTTYYQHILYNAPRLELAYRGLGDIFVVASLSGTERRFDLSAGRILWQDGSAEILASAVFASPDDISFSLNTIYMDVTYFFEGSIRNRRDISVSGSYGFMLELTSTGAGTYFGQAQGEAIPIPSGDRFAALSFLVSLDYASASSWQLEIEQVEITGIVTPSSPSASLRFSGTANESGLEIPSIRFVDGRGALEGGISVDWYYSSYYVFHAEIYGSNRQELYILSGTLRDNRLDLGFSGQGMQLSRISPQNAVANGGFRLSWESVQSFEMEAELSSLVLYRMNEVITASGSVNMNHETLMLRDVAIGYSGLRAFVPGLTVNRADSRAETAGTIQGNFNQSPVDISFRGETVFNSTETWLGILRELEFLDGSLTFDTARYDTFEADEPFSFVFSSLRQEEGFAINLAGGPRNMLRFRYSPGVGSVNGVNANGGSFFAALSAPSPVRGSITGLISPTNIDANSPDIYVDLNTLWRIMPQDLPVGFPNGIVTGSVRVAGPLADPGFYGVLRGTSVHITVPDFIPEPIRPVPVTFQLSGSEMTFGPVAAYVGRGGGQASAWFRFERWIPSVFNLDIRVPPETAIPYSLVLADAGLVADGLASGRLNLAMEDQVLLITGDLTAHNTEISLEGVVEGFEPERIMRNTVLTNISIRAGRRVEFFWPSFNFPILQATADMGSTIHITSDNISERFTLTGDVNLRTGEIFYLERNFYIREGTLFFNESEVSFDPMISARAEMRDIAEDGPVIISMVIDNSPLTSFIPRFESTPPLSPIEIFSLLGHNPQGGEASRNIAASAALDTLAQFTVIRRFQRRARDLLGLDMLSIRTQLIQNMVFQAAGAQPRDDAFIDRPYRVGNYFDNTTVFMGRYFGAAVFGQAMLSVRYDENRTTMGGLILEPEIGFEMRNPLFDIRFNMLPLHPENWFIDDVSVSLLWRRSF